MPTKNLPDAEAQCSALAELLRPHLRPDTAFVGIYSGGAWVAERVADLLGLTTPIGSIDVSFYRDDYERIGLHHNVRPTSMPFEVDGRHIVLFDDVLESGRTTRAALNVLFDFGRPGCVELAVLADRHNRQLPVAATWSVWPVELADTENLILERADNTRLSWRLAVRTTQE
jgi:pyrimidine operon attenuation protein / uracil phosphoribosyltransferase